MIGRRAVDGVQKVLIIFNPQKKSIKSAITSVESISIHVHGSTSAAGTSQVSSEEFRKDLLDWNAADVSPAVRSVARNYVVGAFNCILHANAARLLSVVKVTKATDHWSQFTLGYYEF